MFFILFIGFINLVSANTCADIFRSNEPPLVQQQKNYTCGPASLRSFLLSRGIHLSEAYLSKKLLTNPESGTSAQNMISFLSQLNIRAEAKQLLSIKDLKQQIESRGGAIVNIMSGGEGHWALVVSVSKSHIKLMDPWLASSYRTISLQRFYKIWVGGEGKRMAIMIEP